jgi:electron transport complex protein RnfG
VDIRDIVGSGLLLALFGIVGTGIVAVVNEATQERIAQNERAAVLRSLNEIVPKSAYDNDILNDTTSIADPLLAPEAPVTVYLAHHGGAPVAAVFNAIAPDGYSGPIKLLIGIYHDETLAGVRVVSHRETPGLGDDIEVERSDWILGFDGKSLQNPAPALWRVKREGGAFDQLTGATITPRAVVRAVRDALLYFQAHKGELFPESKSDHALIDE